MIGTVLAGCVHRLKHEKQRQAVLGVKHILLFREPVCAKREQLSRRALIKLEVAGVARIEIAQAEALALGYAERVDVFLNSIKDLLSHHRSASLL